ncbi:MAG: flagellar basal body P-ring formation chaperone FlgA [Methylohalobius sp.]
MRNLKVLSVFGLLLGLDLAVAAMEIQAIESIQQAIVAHLESIVRQHHQNFDIKLAPLDSRLRLPRCNQPLAIFPLSEAAPIGAVSVKVECQGAHPWTIYAKANVRVFQQVAVLARALPKGAVLDQGAVVLESVDIATLRQGYFASLEQVLGRRLKNSLPKGSVLIPQHLATTKVISKGDAVTIRVSEGGLDVRMGGHALMDGGLGQRIRVRNDRSQRVVEGVVQGPGEVQVAF